MKPFYSTPDRIAALTITAEAWRGTPFRANSAVMGVGLSCQFAVAVCLTGSGFAMPEIPKGPVSWSRNQTRSIQEEWMDSQSALFLPLDGRPPAVELLRAGDIVGFKAGLCIHHLGILLPEEKVFQCYEVSGATIISTQETAFIKRLARAWRPVEP